MIKGVTKSGFQYAIDENVLDDMELFDMMAEVDNNPLIASKVLLKILGKKQRDRLYDHVRTDKGNVPMEATMNELAEIFESNAPLKNS